MYSVNEESGLVQPALMLNNPSTFDITVQVTDMQGTEISKSINIIVSSNDLYYM